MTKKIFIDGMSCGHCAARIEKSLLALKGVQKVSVNLEGKFAEVDSAQDLDQKEVTKAIDEAGYHLVKVS